MNTFLLFIILLIFIYEFSKRIKYIENYNQFEKPNNIEKFTNSSITKRTFLPATFSEQYLNDIDIKDISKDLGTKRSINQVKSAYEDDLPKNFFKPLDVSLFRTDLPKWTKCQRPWNECYTYLDPIIEQKEAIKKYRHENPEILTTIDKLGMNREWINPIVISTSVPTATFNPNLKMEETGTWNGIIAPTNTPIPKPTYLQDVEWTNYTISPTPTSA